MNWVRSLNVGHAGLRTLPATPQGQETEFLRTRDTTGVTIQPMPVGNNDRYSLLAGMSEKLGFSTIVAT